MQRTCITLALAALCTAAVVEAKLGAPGGPRKLHNDVPDSFEVMAAFPLAVSISDADNDTIFDCMIANRTQIDYEAKKATFVVITGGFNGSPRPLEGSARKLGRSQHKAVALAREAGNAEVRAATGPSWYLAFRILWTSWWRRVPTWSNLTSEPSHECGRRPRVFGRQHTAWCANSYSGDYSVVILPVCHVVVATGNLQAPWRVIPETIDIGHYDESVHPDIKDGIYYYFDQDCVVMDLEYHGHQEGD
ncbi:hypothetical protein HPB50_003167 [Hyalomma asiaticum]|uniref:Uncharacterized protein n=1 Tax=Hyalomma asiaticum TaxID=266040 RepID=A0ACB7T832_HYAAI|nr:hypothetical protein HPB50_003167 [Hyalomma asiaticum]